MKTAEDWVKDLPAVQTLNSIRRIQADVYIEIATLLSQVSTQYSPKGRAFDFGSKVRNEALRRATELLTKNN